MTVYIREKVILHNRFISADYNTTILLNGSGSSKYFNYSYSDVSTFGMSINSGKSSVYSQELPWNGTFSVSYMASQGDLQAAGAFYSIYSNDQFSVTVVYSNGGLVYRIMSAGNLVDTIPVTIPTPNSTWWPFLTGDDRNRLFNSYFVQKVDLSFSGRDCWISVVSHNDLEFTSKTWSCLQAHRAVNQEISSQDIQVRSHFGKFVFGYDTNTNSSGSNQRIFIGNVYMAGNLNRVSALRLNLIADQLATKLPQSQCQVAYDWNKLSDVSTNGCASYGQFNAIPLSHSFLHTPNFYDCGAVQAANNESSVKIHLCNPHPTTTDVSNVNLAKTRTQLSFNDVISRVTNFEGYNPVVTFDNSNNISSLYLLADKQSGFRTLLTPSFTATNQITIGLSFNLNISSFPTTVLNAINSSITVRVIVRQRFLGQDNIEAVFDIARSKVDNNAFTIKRTTRGGITSNPVSINTGSFAYKSSWTIQASKSRTLSASINEAITDANGVVTQSTLNPVTQASNELELAIETQICYGLFHDCYKPDYITDKNAVLQISQFLLDINQS